ncbi:hypothetical protein [Bradyrhizobium iriomotense]|uniref:hypothetical protein n=1 Tax=Bradyrhizobium iriomotense TaxID=441950 RepID=UPI0024E0E10C|nr:hypothetical protein [Bradyrhizobium iriomotense]
MKSRRFISSPKTPADSIHRSNPSYKRGAGPQRVNLDILAVGQPRPVYPQLSDIALTAPTDAMGPITSSARLSNVAGISMPSALAVLSAVNNNRVLNYREFSFGPNCAFRFNFQCVVQRGQASYVVAVIAPSDFAQL